jgi:hypothetical protein
VATHATGCTKVRNRQRVLVAVLAACLQVLGCATPAAPTATKGAPPASTPSVAPSALGPALRCMDGLLLDQGIADLSLVIDSAPSGDRQSQSMINGYLAATFSDMTQRSRAIRLMMPGADMAPALATTSTPQQPAGVLPARSYALRANFAPNAGVTAQGQTLGLELTLLNAQDLSVVPGAGRHNEIAVHAGPASFTKFGQPFSVSAATTLAGATRALVEISAIELVGRLTRLPYWSCFGVDDSNEAVSAEIQDWYDALAARPAEIISYFQQALRQRHLYDGPVDGIPNAEFREAIARTRQSLGQPREPKLSLEFFRAWLTADAAALASAAASAAASNDAATMSAGATPPVPTPAASAAPRLSLQVSAGREPRLFARGESVNLSIRPSREANVYCFLHDERGRVVRLFPNRFQRESRVAPDVELQLPGPGRFRLVMNPRGLTETVACFATERDVLAELPPDLHQGDLVPLAAESLDQVRAAFINVTGGVLGQEFLELRAR